ncbi:MAG: TonB-dependent receptor, partial [Bacteroidota bacterium]
LEILRGGRSVLYGSDAVAGVINLITKKNTEPQSPTVHLRAAAQSYNTYETNTSLTGGTSKLRYQASLGYLTTQGISEAKEPEGATTEFNRDGAARLNGQFKFNYQPNNSWSIRPTLQVASFDGDYDAGSFQDGDNNYTNDLILPSLAIDHQRGDWTYAGRYNFAATNRVFNSAFGTSNFMGRAHQGELFALLDRNQGGTLTLGTQFRSETLERDDPNLLNLIYTTFSPYAQYSLATEGGFLADLGLRYNNHSEFGGQLNWSIGAGLQTTKAWSTRLNLSSAFQSPTPDQLAGPFGANPELQPQVSTSVELSTQFVDPMGNYRFVVTAFQRNIKDVIVFDFAAGYQNQDE